jgi:sugar lactone lactonase YvrE
VPLSALGNPATIDRINWQDATGAAQPTYYLDDIAVLAAPAQTGFPDATPDGMYTFKPGPSGVAVAPNGRVYAVVYQADQVYSWPTVSSMISGAAPDKTFGTSNGNPDKGCTNAPSPTTMCGPESIAVDHNGNLFVADTYNHRVLVFMNPDTDGSPVKADSVLGQLDLSLGVPDSDSNNADGVMEGFCYVRGLAVDADNHLWAVDEFNFRVIRFDTPLLFGSKPSKVFGQADLDDNPAGCADGASGNSGANQFSLPLGVAVDQQGTLYVTDFDNNRVQRFAADAPNGADAEVSYTSGLDHAHDVAIDGAGNVYIASTFGNQVLVFAGGPNGDLVSDHAFPGRNYPMGMAFTVGGDFLVADCGAPLANTDYPPCLSGERGVYFFAAPEPSQFQPPNAADDSATTPKNNAVSGNVLTNDSDPQASALTVTAFAQPDQGTVTVAASGVFTYTPPADFVGQASFGYTVSNSHDLTDTATVSVTVVESLPKSGLFIPSLSRQP